MKVAGGGRGAVRHRGRPGRGVLADQASIALLAAVGFLLGTGQTLVDTGAHPILPTLVSREAQRLERANGRLVGTQVVTQELAGPPVGGFLFSAAAWIPFAVDAVTFAAGSALVARIAIWTMVGSALGFLVFGLSSDPWLAGAMFGLVGFLTVIFNVVLGSLLGGILARSFGLRSPFVVAGVVIPVVALACLPAINTRTVAEARAAAGLEPGPGPA
jgi:MFS family permease